MSQLSRTVATGQASSWFISPWCFLLLLVGFVANILFGINGGNNLAISSAIWLFCCRSDFPGQAAVLQAAFGCRKRKPFMIGWLLTLHRRYAERPRPRCLWLPHSRRRPACTHPSIIMWNLFLMWNHTRRSTLDSKYGVRWWWRCFTANYFPSEVPWTCRRRETMAILWTWSHPQLYGP